MTDRAGTAETRTTDAIVKDAYKVINAMRATNFYEPKFASEAFVLEMADRLASLQHDCESYAKSLDDFRASYEAVQRDLEAARKENATLVEMHNEAIEETNEQMVINGRLRVELAAAKQTIERVQVQPHLVQIACDALRDCEYAAGRIKTAVAMEHVLKVVFKAVLNGESPAEARGE